MTTQEAILSIVTETVVNTRLRRKTLWLHRVILRFFPKPGNTTSRPSLSENEESIAGKLIKKMVASYADFSNELDWLNLLYKVFKLTPSSSAALGLLP